MKENQSVDESLICLGCLFSQVYHAGNDVLYCKYHEDYCSIACKSCAKFDINVMAIKKSKSE